MMIYIKYMVMGDFQMKINDLELKILNIQNVLINYTILTNKQQQQLSQVDNININK